MSKRKRVYKNKSKGIERSRRRSQRRCTDGRLSVADCGSVCLCAKVISLICVRAVCMWSTFLPLLSCAHPCMMLSLCVPVCAGVCVCAPTELRRGTVELLFPDGTGKQTLQGWQCWQGYQVHSWHCQPPCFPLCTGVRIPAASRPSSLTDRQAVSLANQLSTFLCV